METLGSVLWGPALARLSNAFSCLPGGTIMRWMPPPIDLAGPRGACLDAFAQTYGGLPLHVRSLASHPHPWLLRLSPLLDRLYAISRGHI